MPTTYTHFRFGHDVLKTLPHDIQTLIRGHIDYYHIGLHGPDILFYYRALKRNYVNTLGNRMHEETGRVFFENAAAIYQDHPDEADLAYLYGFICHFVLDARAHGYIGEKVATGVSHAEVESEFDRYLLMEDKLDPLRTHLTNHLHPEDEVCRVISRYFSGISAKTMRSSLKQMIFDLNMLTSPSHLKRHVLLTGLKAAGHYDSMAGLFINYLPAPYCQDSNERLKEIYDEAVPVAHRLIINFLEDINTHHWDEQYDYDFEGQYHGETL